MTSQTQSSNTTFNPFDPEFRANPYPLYPALLEGPPHSVNLFVPTTLVARYDHVLEVLRDPARFSTRRPEMPMRQRLDPFAARRRFCFRSSCPYASAQAGEQGLYPAPRTRARAAHPRDCSETARSGSAQRRVSR